MARTISLPTGGWSPRPHQQGLWDYLVNGGTRAVWAAHRRIGKDELALRWASVAVMRRIGNYWHCLPQSNQARKAIWSAVNPHTGQRRIHETFPPEIIKREIENEMLLEFYGTDGKTSGSTWQLVGSDNYDALVGSPPVGITYSEAALADPASWAYLRPILAENSGWALFISTPRGKNWFHKLYEEALTDPEWYAELTPATQTNVFTKEQLEREKRELIREYGEDQGESLFRTEYLCSFQAGLVGSYFGKEMEAAQTEARIGNVPYDPRIPVHTSWDLGMADATAIWMYQLVGREVRAIDYIENSGVGLDWYVKELQKRPYTWGQHLVPHDAAVRELGTGRSRLETLRSLGIHARIVPAQSIPDGINAVRTLLPTMWLDKTKCKKGIEALSQYRRSWDDKRKCYNDRPYHDWTSHAVDSLKYFATGNVRNQVRRDMPRRPQGFV